MKLLRILKKRLRRVSANIIIDVMREDLVEERRAAKYAQAQMELLSKRNLLLEDELNAIKREVVQLRKDVSKL